jgi:hypothetical protein
MAAIIKEEIIPFKNEILKSLNTCRFDKIKPVREATLETIKLLKEIVGEGAFSISFDEEQEERPA